MKLAFNVPINSVSFGQVSTLLLREVFLREKGGDTQLDSFIFPIGPIDLSSQRPDEEFNRWIQSKILKSFERYTRDIPVFKLWHLNGALESYGAKQTLLSFYELDSPTKIELNSVRNNITCFSSQYTCDIFKIFGADTKFVPIPFDSYNFVKINKQFHQDGRVVFNLCGKFEKRKHHAKVIQAWIKKYGGNSKYALQCAIFNQFLSEQEMNDSIRFCLQGKEKPFNVTFFPMMKSNQDFNYFLNSADVIIGMSGGEGWGLPEFHSVGLGKHALLLNAHAYKTWANESLVTFVEPSGKIPAYDNKFFVQGQIFNQGNIFDWEEENFLEGCEKVIQKVNVNSLNTNGLDLQKAYDSKQILNQILEIAC